MVLLHTISFTPGEACKLIAVGWSLRFVDVIEPFKPTKMDNAATTDGFERSFTKRYMWNMTDFASIIYLDTDSLVVGNLEGCFDIVMPYQGSSSVAVSRRSLT
jgi:alpha-N-acetylglucosamine transferase